MIAALTISASPSRNPASGSVRNDVTSQKTPTGLEKTPARFFPPRRSTAVFPPIAASTIATSDVDVGVADAPHVGRAGKTEQIARDSAADTEHERIAFDARSEHCVEHAFDRRQALARLAESKSRDRHAPERCREVPCERANAALRVAQDERPAARCAQKDASSSRASRETKIG